MTILNDFKQLRASVPAEVQTELYSLFTSDPDAARQRMVELAADINANNQTLDNTTESFFSFGMGPTYRTYFLRDLIPLDNIYETIHAGVGLGTFFEELSNESYFGPGIKADIGMHYRLSKNFHVGTKFSWSHYWVKRDEKFVDEPQGQRTLSLTWLSFGLDFAVYL